MNWQRLLKVPGTLIAGSGNRARLSILIYHRVLAEKDPMLHDEIDAVSFANHMDALRQGFNVLPLSEAVRRLAEGSLPARAAAVTFDDGYMNNATVALPILQERSLPACFFIATGFLNGSCMWNDVVIETLRSTLAEILDLSELGLGIHALRDTQARILATRELLPKLKPLEPSERDAAIDRIVEIAGTARPTGMMMSPDEVRTLSEAGMDIGGHTVRHPILSALPVSQARLEIVEGKNRLEEITGKPVRLFAYPNGRPGRDFDARHVDLVRELGFDAAVTTSHGTAGRDTDRFLLPRFTPWDRSPLRFSLRLYKNVLQSRNRVPGPATSGPSM